MAPEVEIEKRKQAEDTQLGENIDKWKMALTAIAAAAIGGYFVYFGIMVGQPAATDPDKWGTFGDFFGGLMNPIVAFAAFYWLTQSVKLQKQELADTRRELKNAADAQQLLVENGRQSVRLAALTAVTNEIRSRTELIEEMEGKLKRDIELQRLVSTAQVTSLRNELLAAGRYKKELQKDIEMYFLEMREILDASSSKIRTPIEEPPQAA